MSYRFLPCSRSSLTFCISLVVLTLSFPVHTFSQDMFKKFNNLNNRYFGGRNSGPADWMKNVIGQNGFTLIAKELEKEAQAMINKYTDPDGILTVASGWDDNTRTYIMKTQSQSEYRNQYRIPNRTAAQHCGEEYSGPGLIYLYDFLKLVLPTSQVLPALGNYIKENVERSARFCAYLYPTTDRRYKKDVREFEEYGEAQPFGGFPDVSANDVQRDPLRIWGAIPNFIGKPVPWDGDIFRHLMYRTMYYTMALKHPDLNVNKALIQKYLSHSLQKYLFYPEGDLRDALLVKELLTDGLLRVPTIILNLSYGYEAMMLNNYNPVLAQKLLNTARRLMSGVMGRGAGRGFDGRLPIIRNGRPEVMRFYNVISGLNPATALVDFGVTYKAYGSLNNFDSNWFAWSSGPITMAYSKLYNILDRKLSSDKAIQDYLAFSIHQTAKTMRYRAAMPFVQKDGITPVLDKEGNPIINTPVIGATYPDDIAPGTKLIRSFYESTPSSGLSPNEYHRLWDSNTQNELIVGNNMGAIFRKELRNNPTRSYVGPQIMEDYFRQSDKYNSIFTKWVHYPEGHPKAGQKYCVDDKHKELDCTRGGTPIARQANTPGKFCDSTGCKRSFSDGWNTQHRGNDTGSGYLLVAASLISKNPEFADMGILMEMAKLKRRTGPMYVTQVQDIVDFTRFNSILGGRMTDRPFVWGRALTGFLASMNTLLGASSYDVSY